MTPWTLERMTAFLKRAGRLMDASERAALNQPPEGSQPADWESGLGQAPPPPLKPYGLGTSKFIYKGPRP